MRLITTPYNKEEAASWTYIEESNLGQVIVDCFFLVFKQANAPACDCSSN